MQATLKSEKSESIRCKPSGRKKKLNIAPDETLTVLEEFVFYKIKTAAGKIGYISKDKVSLISNEPVSKERSKTETKKETVQKSHTVSATPLFKPVFKPVTFKHEQFIGSQLISDADFVPFLERLAGFAERTDIKIYVTSSLRNINSKVKGAIVTPARRSCHFIGHAIDMNLSCSAGFFNSKKLALSNLPNCPENIRQFLDLVRADDYLRWGGDFSKTDPVHIDSNLFNKHKEVYETKLENRVRQLNG